MNRFVISLFILDSLFILSAAAANRVALVIGNNTYQELPMGMQLTSPKNDATDIAIELKKMG
jgi:hypothetical protein